jgi:hypothetical protein
VGTQWSRAGAQDRPSGAFFGGMTAQRVLGVSEAGVAAAVFTGHVEGRAGLRWSVCSG